MSPEVVALLVLAAGAVAAVAFTLVVVVVVDRSATDARPSDEGTQEQENEER